MKLTRKQYSEIINRIFPFNQNLKNDVEPAEFKNFKERVKDGKVVINAHVRQQIRLIDSMVKDPAYYVDVNAIDNFIKFVDTEMTLTDGSPARGKITPSFKLWAEDILCWYKKRKKFVIDPVTKVSGYEETFERVRTCMVLIVGRGNAKSLFSTWLSAYLLVTSSSKIDAIASADTIDHAQLVLDPLTVAITNPVGPLFNFLSQRYVTKDGIMEQQLVAKKNEIVNEVTSSKLTMNAMRDSNFQSFRPNLVILDEVHQVTEDVIQSAIESASKTSNPLVLITTSEGVIRDGVFDNNKKEWLKVLKSSETKKPIYDISVWWYCLDSLDEVQRPETWEKANPNLGITVQPDTLQRDISKLIDKPGNRPGTLSHRFGLPMTGSVSFFEAEQTLRNSSSFEPLKLGQRVWLGVDLSQHDDLSSFTFVWTNSQGLLQAQNISYTPEETFKKLKGIYHDKYKEFIAEDSLRLVKGSVNDMKSIVADLYEFISKNQLILEGVGYDYAYSATWLNLWTEYVGDYNLKKIYQSALNLSSSLYEIRNLFRDGGFIHDQAILEWSMRNLTVKVDEYENVKPNKKRKSDKIDPVAALIDAYVIRQQTT